MRAAFEAVGLEIPNQLAFHHLALRAGNCGEPTVLTKKDCAWLGRCWKLGDGLEVWTIFYQSTTGEVCYADCRPAFRPHSWQKISPWALTEYALEGEALLHGFLEDSNTEILLAVQNLTEIRATTMKQKFLRVGLCGLAYGARIEPDKNAKFWKQTENSSRENDWSLRGKILNLKTIRNRFSGSDLIWFDLDLGKLQMEILVNQRNLRGEHPKIGSQITADVWLQGYIFDNSATITTYEGVDAKRGVASFWENLRRRN